MSDILSVIYPFAYVAIFMYGVYRLAQYMDERAMSTDHTDYKRYYSVPMKPEEIQSVLLIPACWGDWKSEFLPQENMLLFHHKSGIGGRRRFYILVTDMGNFSVLSAAMLSGSMRGLNVDLDGFLAHKLNAVAIPNKVMRPNP